MPVQIAQNVPPETTQAVVILGGGPAGLTAAYELSRNGVCSVVLEQDAMVGGLARTVDYKGYLFDIGGHRFYTKVALIEQIWNEVLGDDFLTRPRLSRIFYRSKFFNYPLEVADVLKGLGLWEVFLTGLSYAKAHLLPETPEDDLATWVSNRFGRRLYRTFFESYTEKVWGMKCHEIKAEWAAQRIRGLSFLTLLGLKRDGGKGVAIKTLIKEFQYPRRGPGMMWSKMANLVEKAGSVVVCNAPVTRILWEQGRFVAVEAGGRVYRANYFINTLPLRTLIRMLDPVAPDFLQRASGDFRYRDFVTVGLIVRGRNLFPDNWIYIHDPHVSVARIQNYTNWSPEMSPDPNTSCLGMEYFCFEGDGLWSSSDDDLLTRAHGELDVLGLVRSADVMDGTVIRVPKAYPVYDDKYQCGIEAVRAFLRGAPNLQTVGRNGMHRYNNQDHSMLTGLLAARNILGAHTDLWELHTDADYLEEAAGVSQADLRMMQISQPRVPEYYSAPPESSRDVLYNKQEHDGTQRLEGEPESYP